MTSPRPVLVALPLDHQTPDIVSAASATTQKLGAPAVVVHALSPHRRETNASIEGRIRAAKAELEPHVEAMRSAGVEIAEVRVEVGDPAEFVLMSAHRACAQMIVTGGGRPATIRRWVLGSVAEAVVRRASVPVWIARGAPPSDGPLLCPVDLSPESELGLKAGLTTARQFGLSVTVLSVVENPTMQEVKHRELVARTDAESLLAKQDTDGVEVTIQVVTGDPAEEIVKAASDAKLLVVASRGYDPLVREWLGPVTSRTLRYSACSALLIRNMGDGHEERTRAITYLGDLYQRAHALLLDARPAEALPLLEVVAERAPANAAVQQAYGEALENLGQRVEAHARKELAKQIRERLS